jgi:predicted nucleic acid-binding protein
MHRKVCIYLDTSVLSALFQPPFRRQEITRLFFNEILPRYDVFISELVIDEIDATPYPARRRMLRDAVKNFSILSTSGDATNVQKKYLQYLKIPRRDALHIAIASVEGINYLVTWNMEHLATERTRRIVDNVNFLLTLPRIYIVTPRDFFE